MSHKTNPTSLRLLNSNTSFVSAWFGAIFYEEKSINKRKIRFYLQQLFKVTLASELTPVICAQSYYRKHTILQAVHDLRGIRREKEFSFGLRKQEKRTRISSTFLTQQAESATQPRVADLNAGSKARLESSAPATAQQGVSQVIEQRQQFTSPSAQRLLGRATVSQASKRFREIVCSYTMSLLQSERSAMQAQQLRSRVGVATACELLRPDQHKRIRLANPTQSIQIEHVLNANSPLLGVCDAETGGQAENSVLSTQAPRSRAAFYLKPVFSALQARNTPHTTAGCLSGVIARTCCNLDPVRVVSDLENAYSLIDHIINLVERRQLWRRIKQSIFRDLESTPFVKGIRLRFSGRVGAASKKAQKAKVETHSWGAIGLNTFSSRVSFASKSAHTSFGKIGVKVWIAYK